MTSQYYQQLFCKFDQSQWPINIADMEQWYSKQNNLWAKLLTYKICGLNLNLFFFFFFFCNVGAIAKETNHSYLCSFKMKTNFFFVNDNAMFLQKGKKTIQSNFRSQIDLAQHSAPRVPDLWFQAHYLTFLDLTFLFVKQG